MALVRTLRPNVKQLALTLHHEELTFLSNWANSLILNRNEFSMGTTSKHTRHRRDDTLISVLFQTLFSEWVISGKRYRVTFA